MKHVAIIQGRMSSKRLPGKILMDIEGSPLLAHVIRRAEAANIFDTVVFATSTNKEDDPVAEYCTANGKKCFRGDLNDVLERYYQAARTYEAEVVTRLTADCPLLDPAVVKKVVQTFDPNRYDYVSNAIQRTYPDGLDTEVFSMAALTRARNEAKLSSEREHVTPYIHKHPELFRIAHVTQKENLSVLRWTVDEPRDLAFVRAIFAELGNGAFGQKEVLALLARKPELQTINEGITCNEGYKKSVNEDPSFPSS
ncbi:MAG: glycosyltransferase family protein [Candidatus Peribacteraceae bacterium]|nr:glycosyltransferase family protein [Candidatus Peribacteraceae bacterium]MDD5740043.1 glycosyltransferase family protein [Candidatus Peribacteraceae bacterium]